MRITLDNTMALVIDYQERLMPPIGNKETLVSNSRILLAGLESLRAPLIISEQYPQKLGSTLPEIKEVAAGAKAYPKTAFSCWQDQALKQAIFECGRKNIILCGLETHICVLQTAVDLMDAGYQVVYVADCLGSRRKHDHKLGLERLRQEGCLAATYESILFELTVGKDSPSFKTISNLVK